jgi:hypothetical protein
LAASLFSLELQVPKILAKIRESNSASSLIGRPNEGMTRAGLLC